MTIPKRSSPLQCFGIVSFYSHLWWTSEQQ